jgi:saxitoxin biosynthesis operon SxtJ-like protein
MDHKSTTKELRSFGLLVGGVFTVIGLWPLLVHDESLRLWAVVIGGLLIVCGVVVPRALAPVHQGWMWIGHVLGWINTRILLGIVFFGLVTPIGVVFRLMGKDTMRQAFSELSSTYRVTRQPRPRSHMKYQF